MTLQEAAALLGKSESTLRRWINSEKLNAYKVDGHYEIDEEEVNRLSNDKQFQSNDEVLFLREQVTSLTSQLEAAHREANQAAQQQNMIIMQLTRQMEKQTLMLEDHKQPWYRRMFHFFSSQAEPTA